MGSEKPTAIVMGPKERLRLVVQLAVLALFIWATREAFEYRPLARYMPVFAGSLGIFATVSGIIIDQLRYRRGISAAVASLGEATLFAQDPDAIRSWVDWPLIRALRYIGWMVLFAAALFVLDILVVGPLFVVVFYIFEADVEWWRALLYGVAAAVLIWLLTVQVGLTAP